MGIGANSTDPAAVTVHGTNPQVRARPRNVKSCSALLGLLGDIMPLLRLPTLRCLWWWWSVLRGTPPLLSTMCPNGKRVRAGRETLCPALLAQTLYCKS